MNCIYCPRNSKGLKIGGENLIEIPHTKYCNIQSVKNLVKEFCKYVLADKDRPVLRITGGEPFYRKENIVRTLGVLSCADNYQRIVICTNGISFETAYNENSKLFEKLKKRILLKISLDSLDESTFQHLTGTKEGVLPQVKAGIEFAAKKKFKVELNVVATKNNLSNLDNILTIFEYAKNNGLIGIKILTVNDFGGNVTYGQQPEDFSEVTKKLQKLIEILKSRDFEEREAFLNDNKGIRMKKFVYHYADIDNEKDRECTITIVDHHNDSSSITPRRTFSKFCLNCKYYPSNARNNNMINPCATGVMSFTLRADGLFSPCRLLIDSQNAVNISNLKSNVIHSHLEKFLKEYDECWYESKETT